MSFGNSVCNMVTEQLKRGKKAHYIIAKPVLKPSIICHKKDIWKAFNAIATCTSKHLYLSLVSLLKTGLTDPYINSKHDSQSHLITHFVSSKPLLLPYSIYRTWTIIFNSITKIHHLAAHALMRTWSYSYAPFLKTELH